MNRRDALKNLFLMGSSITLGSFSHSFLGDGSQHNAGEFNLYVGDGFFPIRTWDKILNATLEKFQEKGIGFEKIDLLIRQDKFPKLTGLDMLIAATSDSLKYYAGYFGVSTNPVGNYGWGRKDLMEIDIYQFLKEKINLPYDRQVSRAHVGVVCLENTCANMETEEKKETAVINTLAHEIGHGLGASHVYDNKAYRNKKSKKHIMSQPVGGNIKEFCNVNVRAMKDFIDFVNTNNLDDLNLIWERSKRLSQCVYLEDL